jgi:RNA-dependent RNA polymerase
MVQNHNQYQSSPRQGASHTQGFAPKPHRFNAPVPRQGVVLLPRRADWETRPDLSIKIRNLQSATTTYDIYRNFKQHGEIVYIELFQHKSTGLRDGNARVKFSPPPTRAFWGTGQCVIRTVDGKGEYNVRIEPEFRNNGYQIQSPVKKTVFYDPEIKLYVNSLHFGLKVDRHSVMCMHTASPKQQDNGPLNREDVTLAVDLRRKKLLATFQVTFQDPRTQGNTDYDSLTAVGELSRVNKFKFWIPFDQLQQIQRINLDGGGFALIISLDSPAQFYRKREDDESCHSDENNMWSENDSWFRQTDIVYDPYRLGETIITLHKEQPVIDIGMYSS